MLRKLGVEAGEGKIFAWSAAVLFVLGWTDATVQNVAEALFIKRLNVEALLLAFMASSTVLVGTLVLFGRIATRVDPVRLLPRTLLALAAVLPPFWLVAQLEFAAVYPLLVVLSGHVTYLPLLAFFTAANELLHPRQSKRLYALMMMGVTLGTIAGHRVGKHLALALGVESLLVVAAGMFVLGAAASLPLRHLRPRFDTPGGARAHEPAPAEEGIARFRELWRESLFFRLMFGIVLCSGMLGPMLYYQFQYVADQATPPGDAEALMSVYGDIKSWMYVGVFFVQLLVVRTLYRTFGVPLSTLFSPIIYLLGFVGLSMRLNLTVGVGAMAGTKLQDKAVYDPAVRVLHNLFPESVRAQASALLDGPAKRFGGVAGNLTAFTAIQLGTALWVGYAAIPIALVWLGVAIVLWRRYPQLLLEASAGRSRDARVLDDVELLDRATVRSLIPEMSAEDAARARIAVALVSEAEPRLAVEALAEAASAAPAGTRHLAVAALDQLLEASLDAPLESGSGALHLAGLLEGEAGLVGADRADIVQAYARLLPGEPAVAVLERELASAEPCVRLAARAALVRRGVAAAGSAPELDAELARAVGCDDPAARRTAREELRALLLEAPVDALWSERLSLLAGAFPGRGEAAEVATALAEVARRHGEAAADAWEPLAGARDDEDPVLRAALLRFAGGARLQEQTGWLVEHLDAADPGCAEAARAALVAQGSLVSNVLLRELAYGKRGKRQRILEVMRELDLHPDALRGLYEAELDLVEQNLGRLVALEERRAFALLRQQLVERVREELHTALLYLAAIRREDRIVEIGRRLREVEGRRHQHAIVVDALESVVAAEDRRRLLPLLEDPDFASATRMLARRGPVPTLQAAVSGLLEDPDELTRSVAAGSAVAAGFEVEDAGAVEAIEKVKRLASVPLFEGLSVRQLMDLSAVVREHRFASDHTVVAKGEADDCLYIVVEGVVHIRDGEALLREQGPGEYFGEIALFAGVARTASAVTRTQARLLSLERRDLIRLIEELPGIAVTLLEVQSRRVQEMMGRPRD